jgi:hypothetical protein
MTTQLSLFIVSIFVGLWVISNIIETTAFDEVYPLSYPGICKQRLRINTLCNKLDNDVNKHSMKNSAGLIPPPNMSNDISKKMDSYLHHDHDHHLHEYIEEEPHPDDVDLGNEDDSHSNTNILSRFAHGLLLFTIISLYCIYMSGRKNERNHYDGRVLPVYN